MKYVSIDIETTGLDPETCQVLEIGAVIEDTNNIKPIEELPKFSCILDYPVYTGRPFALMMNVRLLKILASLETNDKDERERIRRDNNIMAETLGAKAFQLWLLYNGFPMSDGHHVQITVAGKNFGTFDKRFLEKLPDWNKFIRVNQRILDPTALCTDWKTDEKLPSLDQCMQRLNVSGVVTHDAVQDAIDVVRVLRAATNNYSTSSTYQQLR